MGWFRTSKGRLFVVADASGALMRVIMPLAWTLAMPDMTRPAFAWWIAVGVLYFVHHVTLSSAVRRDRDRQKPTIVSTTTIDGVPLSAEDAARVRAIVEGARKSKESESEEEKAEARLPN